LSAGGGTKRVATSRSNAALADLTGAVQGTVVTDANGAGEFRCNDRAVSVRVRR
jgi:alpha amylase-like protein